MNTEPKDDPDIYTATPTGFIGPQIPSVSSHTITVSPNAGSDREDDSICELKKVWKSDLLSKCGVGARLRSSTRRLSHQLGLDSDNKCSSNDDSYVTAVETDNITVMEESPAIAMDTTESTPSTVKVQLPNPSQDKDQPEDDCPPEVTDQPTEIESAQPQPSESAQPDSNEMETGDTQLEEETAFNFVSRIHFDQHTELTEVAKWRTTKKEQYTRGSVWSPDGTCLLTAVNQLGIFVFDTPTDLYEMEQLNKSRKIQKLEPAFHIRDSKESNIYDMVWYPGMTSSEPATCCFLVTRQHEPIHCYDGFDGSLRCTYRAYDDVDECEAALSVAFSTDGAHILGGFKKSIKTFLTERAGRDFETIRTKSAVSAISATEHIIAAGSWNTTISLYDQRSHTVDAPILTVTGEHKGGITHLKMLGDNWLVSGARKDNKLVLWDLRNALVKPYCIFNREVTTNQKIYFDFSIEGKWLFSGSTNGELRAWNLFDSFADPKAVINEYSYPLYDDCCNGVSIHPSLPLVASSSGQFRFGEDDRRQNFVTMWWLQQPQEK